MSTRKRLAVHEAGHGALAAHYGLVVSRVTIAPTRDAMGLASCGGNLADISSEVEAEKHIRVAFAGTLAERQILPDSEPGLWRASIATSLAIRFWPHDTSARLVLYATEAAQDVRDARRDIERVAAALLDRETLNGAELREILATR